MCVLGSIVMNNNNAYGDTLHYLQIYIQIRHEEVVAVFRVSYPHINGIAVIHRNKPCEGYISWVIVIC